MSVLCKGVSYAEVAGVADGFDDGESQSARLAASVVALVEAVEEACGVYLSFAAGVGNAQCSLLYIDVYSAMSSALALTSHCPLS